MDDADRFVPVGEGPTGLFVDSSALFAYFYPGDAHHDDATAFFDGLRRGRLPYRPLFVDDYVLDETVTLLAKYSTHAAASAALDSLYDGGVFRFESVTNPVLEAAVESFHEFDDHDELSFTDHVVIAHCDALDVDHVYSYDDDFDAFEPVRIPHYTA